MIGLVGCNGVGKTTLAKAFALKQDIPFVATSTSAVFERLGMDPKAEYSFAVRLQIQEAILTALEGQYALARKSSALFIADRTPFDLAAYTLADIQRSTLHGDQETTAAAMNYVQRCFKAAAENFSVIALVQPGIALVERDGKAQSCPAFMEHFNAIAFGLLVDERNEVQRFMIPRSVLSVEARVMALSNAAAHALKTNEAVKEAMVFH